MRIALVTDTYLPEVNGVTTVLRRMAGGLDRRGVEVAVAAPSYGDPSPEPVGKEYRAPSFPFPPYPAIRMSVGTGGIRRFLDDFRPDVIHVVTEGPLGLAGRRYALRHGIPLVTSYHTNFPQYARHYHAGVLEPLIWRWLVRFHRPAAMVQTPGTASYRELVARGLRQAVLWGRGVEATFFRPERRTRVWRQRLDAPRDEAIVLHVGRMAPEKNLDVLVSAWRMAREAVGSRAVFVIAGEGPYLHRVAEALPWVRFLGFLPRSDLAELYASADICVLPSATETCGLVALEAMASGLPVVAADAGGLRENVRHGRTGVLVPPEAATEFATAVVDLVMNPWRRRAFGENARIWSLSRDVEIELDELVGQYAYLAGQPEGVPVCVA